MGLVRVQVNSWCLDFYRLYWGAGIYLARSASRCENMGYLLYEGLHRYGLF
jgi:hypothetical protein